MAFAIPALLLAGIVALAVAAGGREKTPVTAGGRTSTHIVEPGREGLASTASGEESTTGSSGSGRRDPAAVIRAHYEALGAGRYASAFRLMSARYRARNPRWVAQRSAARPGVRIESIGSARIAGPDARVPITFIARDHRQIKRSDTKCRRFRGSARMIRRRGTWRYDPSSSGYVATVLESWRSACP